MIGNIIFYVYVLNIVTNLFNTTWKDTYLNKYGNVLTLQKKIITKIIIAAWLKQWHLKLVFIYWTSWINKRVLGR